MNIKGVRIADDLASIAKKTKSRIKVLAEKSAFPIQYIRNGKRLVFPDIIEGYNLCKDPGPKCVMCSANIKQATCFLKGKKFYV